MAESTGFEALLQQLATTQDAGEQAALIAESAFAQLPDTESSSGLLARYRLNQLDLLTSAAALAAPIYQAHPNQRVAGQEALFCWLVAGDGEKAQR